METGTVIALVVVLLVVGGGFYLLSQSSSSTPLLGAGAPDQPTQSQSEAAQIIAASGGAVGSILGGVGSLYSNIGRQAGGSAPGGVK